ncbi:carbonic anhydrase [Saccharopolyspora taberi]|uniref:carbonic anhydrase n=1 Tax=Saccharopolyspora taberi TaxID=60895 RepID=A0ABN3VDF0_9PSEU
MTASDEILRRNALHVRGAEDRNLPTEPSLRVAIVTCMDCRIDLYETLGLRTGEAHVIRNAGGAVTDDVIRSLAVSQRKLGTREVMLMHHTRCGMATFTEGEFKDELERETGQRPAWSVETYTDAAQDVRQSMARIRRSPFLGLTTSLRGFVKDIDNGALTEVFESAPAEQAAS